MCPKEAAPFVFGCNSRLQISFINLCHSASIYFIHSCLFCYSCLFCVIRNSSLFHSCLFYLFLFFSFLCVCFFLSFMFVLFLMHSCLFCVILTSINCSLSCVNFHIKGSKKQLSECFDSFVDILILFHVCLFYSCMFVLFMFIHVYSFLLFMFVCLFIFVCLFMFVFLYLSFFLTLALTNCCLKFSGNGFERSL